MSSAEAIERHRAAGRFFEAGGVRSFVREEGDGEPVVCLHGVPASSFLYRKLLPELASRGLRGVAFDLPGLGLADRPRDFDYSWSGLGRFAVAAVDALGLDRFHLVVHDVGGPVGFELVAAMPDRIRSLTILDTPIEVDSFKRPWFMEPFAHRPIGEIAVRTLAKPAFLRIIHQTGVKDRDATPKDEWYAYVDLLKREDGGRAFLQIMRGFERTREKRDLYVGAVGDLACPKQVVWASDDPALSKEKHGEHARRAAGVDDITVLPGRHFFQEEQAPELAELVAALASESR